MRLQPVILAACLPLCCSTLSAQKLVTIGDSQTSLCGWQPSVVEQTGYTWSREETTVGLDGHQPMAVGGTWMKPINANAICLRGRDASYYSPDKVIIYGGQNDALHYWVSADNTGLTPLETVEQESAYHGEAIDGSVTSLAAFKGLIEHLQAQCPETQIYLMTHVPVLCVIGMNPDDTYAQYYPSPRFADLDDVIRFEQSEREPKDALIRAMGEYYDLPVIDLWQYSGITYYNTALFYSNPAGDCTQVHLNRDGELRIARCIADYLLNAPTRYDASWIPSSFESQDLPGIDSLDVCEPSFDITGKPLRQHDSQPGFRCANGVKTYQQ